MGVKYHARLSDALRADSRFQSGAYYTAAFVRNPWDRLVSWYVVIAGSTAFVPEGHSLFHRQNLLRQGVLRKARSFDEFILHCPNVADRAGRMPFSLNQIDYLTDTSGDIAVDFIGRFENFADSAATLLRLLGLPEVRVPHLNRTHHDGYRAYYTNETRDVVRRRFERDIEAFGYTF